MEYIEVQKGAVNINYNQEIISGSSYNLNQLPVNEIIYNLAISQGYNSYEANKFLSIARCESTLNPNAIGYASKPNMQFLGLFQILYPGTWNGHACEGNITSITDNTMCAFQIQRRSGWDQWECNSKTK